MSLPSLYPGRGWRALASAPARLLGMLALLAVLTGCGQSGESADKRVPAAVMPTGPVDLVLPKDAA